MLKLWAKMLLLFMGVAALIWLAVRFDVYVVPWFATMREIGILFARGLILRWLLRPVGRTLSLVLLYFGWRVRCRFCKRVQARLREVIAGLRERWKDSRPQYQLVLWGLAIIALLFTVWGIYLLLVFAPMFAPLLKRAHTWGFGRAFAHWTRPSAQWFNRMTRKHPVFKRLAVMRTLRFWLVQKVRHKRRMRLEPKP